MSTHSNIGIKYGDKVKYIYCHEDGYLSTNGVMLEKFFKDKSKLEKILKYGDLVCLGYSVEAPIKFNPDDKTYYDKILGYSRRHIKTMVCRFFNVPGHDIPIDEQVQEIPLKDYDNTGVAFAYLYVPEENKWYVCFNIYGKSERYDLTKVLTNRTWFDKAMKLYWNEPSKNDLDYEWSCLQNMKKAISRDFNGWSVVDEYNEFIKSKGITDVEFGEFRIPHSDKVGYALYYVLQPGQIRRSRVKGTEDLSIGSLVDKLLTSRSLRYY